MKKKKSNWIKKGIGGLRKNAFVYLIAVSMILPLFVGLLGMMQDDREISSNILTTTTKRTVLDVALSSSYEVNQYIYNGHYGGNPPSETNMSVSYNSTENAAQLTITRNVTGQFVFAGFTPALKTSISFEFKHLSWGFNGMGSGLLNFLFCGGVANYQSMYKMEITYYDTGGGLKTWQKDSTIWGVDAIPWVRYTIDWYPDRTFNFKFEDVENGGTLFSGSNMTRQNWAFDKPDSLFPSWFLWSFSTSSSADYETDYWMFIRNLKQTIDVYVDDIYADIPSESYAGWGTDGLYNETYENDTQILDSVNGKMTVFWDINLKNPGGGNPEWTEAMMADLISRGYEFGIHTNTKATYSEAEIADLESQFNELYALAIDNGWINSSIAWTSLGNDYHFSYNNYVYEYWDNSIGRKIWTHDYVNLGHLFGVGDTDNTMILNASERGFPYIGYYHRSTGEVPDVDYADWYNLLNETIANDLIMVGYIEYWARYSAMEKVSGSIDSRGMLEKHIIVDYEDLILPNNVKIEIKVREAALDLTPFDEFTLQQNGEDLSYESVDGWLIFEVSEGTIIFQKDIFILNNFKEIVGVIGFFGLLILPAVALWSAKQNSENNILSFGRVSMTMIALFGCFIFGFFM